MNPTWDDAGARARIEALGLPLTQKVGRLSGGQQAQVALTLALAKRPDLLLLDEPVASLDPLARRQFLQAVMEAVAETGMTVVLASHIVAELERVCDHLVILSHAHTQLVGPIDEILGSHRVLVGPRSDAVDIARVHDVVRASQRRARRRSSFARTGTSTTRPGNCTTSTWRRSCSRISRTA